MFAALTGNIQGTVFDPSGAVVADAKVTIKSLATGASRTVTTSSQGQFASLQLDIGSYEVAVDKGGFRTTTLTAVVRSGETTRLDFNLQVGQSQEVISVEGGITPTLDVATAQVSSSIDDRSIVELPVQNRDPVAFAALAPGVVPVSKDNPFLGSGSFNANGSRGRGNNITVDNITASDISTTGASGTGTFSLDGVQEFKLITNNFSAEFGRNSGAQVQIITKSGTNQFHGTAYWFHQNAFFNARDYFDSTGAATPLRYNTWGFTFGGPVIKDKTFFFGHYEGNKIRGAGSSAVATVLTPAQQAAITDPTSAALFAGVGAPTSASGSLSSAAPNQFNQYSWSIRIDQVLRGGKDLLTGRFGTNPNSNQRPSITFIGTNLPNFGAGQVAGANSLNLGWTHTFSPSVVNQFRFAYGRSSPVFTPASTLKQPFGPLIQISGFDALGVSRILPQGRVQNTFQWTDSVSWATGRHSLKIGGDVFRYQLNDFFDANFRGIVQFGSVGDFQAGNPLAWIQNFGTSHRHNRATDIFWYGQDDIRLTDALTLNLGLRIESSGGVSEVNGLLSNLNRNHFTTLGGAQPGPLGTLDLGGSAFHRNTNYAPRLGFAWNPGRGKLVVRGGYGWAYDYIFLNPITNLRFSAPFVPSITFQGPFTGANTYANFVAGTAQAQTDAQAAVGVFLPTQVNFGAISPVDQHLKNPRAQQWNFGLEYQVTPSLVVKASYVATKTDFLQASLPVNLVQPGKIPAPAASEADELARFAAFKNTFTLESGTATGTVVNNRLDPRFNGVTEVESVAGSNFHSLQFDVVKRFSHGFAASGSYTYGHSIDNASDALNVLVNDTAALQDPRNLSLNRANSEFDLRQRMTLNLVYQIPWTKRFSGAKGKILDGWGVSGILDIHSGVPATILSGSRRGISDVFLLGGNTPSERANGNAVLFHPVPFGSAAAANIPAPCARGVNTSATSTCTNTSNFPLTQPLLGNGGTSGRNSLPLAGLQNLDWAFLKDTKIAEKYTLQFRWEVYNVLNHPNFSGLQNVLTSPSFGTYQSTATNMRQMQGSLKFIF